MNIVKREAVYIPIKDLSVKEKDKIKEELTFNFFAKEKTCEECEWYAERVNDVCESCANFKGQYQLATQVKVGNNKYLKIPVGSSKKIIDRIGRYQEVTVVDKSPKTKIKPIKFTGQFKEGQGEAVAGMVEKKRGVFRAPPRSGKCVEGSTIVYTDAGPVRIDSLFKGIPLSPRGSTEITPKNQTKIQTSEGLKDIAGLYTKIVDRTVKITTVYGKSIRGTENHPVQVAREGCELTWVPLSEIRVGDYVVTNNQDAWYAKSTRLLEPSNGLHKYINLGTTNNAKNAA